MKVSIELNANELISTIASGALLTLAEVTRDTESTAKEAANIIKSGSVNKSADAIIPGQVTVDEVKEAKEPAQKSEQANTESTSDEYIPTVVELRALAQEKGSTPEGKKAIKALLDKYESKSISTVPEDKRASFMAELGAL